MNDSSATLYDGVDLLGFFTAPTSPFSYGITGNLTPPSSAGLPYNATYGDSYPGARTNMNLGRAGGSALQTFATDTPALTGAATANLIFVASLLPAPGTTGDVIVRWSGAGSHAVIGQWEAVVPEPSMLVLAAGGAVVFLARRRNVTA